jgi:hypothetical protein
MNSNKKLSKILTTLLSILVPVFVVSGIALAVTTIGEDIITQGDLTVDTNTLYVDSVNHRVGIGTTNPGAKLQIEAATANITGLTIKTTDDSTNNYLAKWLDSSGNMLLGIKADGDIVTDRNSATLTFLGMGAGASNTVGMGPTGKYNTFLGNLAGYNNSSGFRNTAIGFESLYSNTTGADNVAIGFGAMRSHTDGIYNVAVGNQALFQDTTGAENTAVGYSALCGNTTGIYNSAFGHNALAGNNTGSRNSALGAYALKSVSGSGSYNSVLGYSAMLAVTSGEYNAVLGAEAGYNNQTGSNNIFIGYQAGYNETGSNKLYIENSNADSANALIYGEFDNDILAINGNVGIGTTSLTEKFYVNGTAHINGSAGGIGGIKIENTGDVFIGTVGSGNNLSVSGYIRSYVPGSFGNYIILSASGSHGYISTNEDMDIVFTPGQNRRASLNSGLSLGGNYYETTAPTNGAIVEGNVGIGTTSPVSKLQVDGYIQMDMNSGAPAAGDCDSDTERGRTIMDYLNNRLYICNGAARGWDYVNLSD